MPQFPRMRTDTIVALRMHERNLQPAPSVLMQESNKTPPQMKRTMAVTGCLARNVFD